ncbi:MAG: TlpA family protein disulfide reductase [Alphaproteobacteria bacterium]|nr:TlpA family protein disulfide reductase [Alphaproteobacteria bacterium]
MSLRLIPVLLLTACAPHLYSTLDTDGEWTWEAPTNAWPVAEPPAGTLGVGLNVGQTVPELRMVDQNGDEVSTWQFFGRVWVMDISTMWCAPCQELAGSTQATQDHFGWDEFAYITVLQENVESQPPDVDDLGQWAGFFDIDAPVLGDGDKLTGAAIQNGVYPAVLLIDRNLVVHERVIPANEATLDAAVASLLGE